MTESVVCFLFPFFEENSGVVASGYLDKSSNEFMAYEILAKHDESYMPVKIEVEN